MEVKHLYIHIPFCNSICTYCDFTRFVCNESIKTKYINKIIRQINLRFDKKNKLDSIYIGGGTPNCLNEQLLNKLLGVCKKLVSTKTEFTIECNPELITKQQALTFKSNKINRISLGIQFCNNKLLKKYGRKTTILSCEQAIRILQSHNISNISGDFIYGLNELTKHDIKSNIEFIKKNKLTHCSFYSLEIKSGSLLNKGGYQINDEKVEEDLSNIEKQLKSIHFNRYEISNWCYNQKYESIHNKAYWLTKEWIGIGLGASGFENRNLYQNIGSLNKWAKNNNQLSLKDYYFQIIMMGLRMKKGIDLKNKVYKKAYEFYKNKIKYTHIVNNCLTCNNFNLLNLSIIDCL